MKVEDLLPEKYRDKALDYEKGMDTMDVWFDSGIWINDSNVLLNIFLSKQIIDMLWIVSFHCPLSWPLLHPFDRVGVWIGSGGQGVIIILDMTESKEICFFIKLFQQFYENAEKYLIKRT